MTLDWMYEKFKELFNRMPEFEGFAPGRVNLIGEHTDYTGGLVFPAALDIGTYTLAAVRDDSEFRVFSMNFTETGIRAFRAGDAYLNEDGWVNYPKGVASILKSHGYTTTKGMDILFWGNIPNGAGLSSSASIELAMGVLMDWVFSFNLDRVQLVQLCKETENDFIGVKCGIMDQFIIGMGKKESALRLDTHDLSFEHVPLNLADHKIVIFNSMVQRTLSDSLYNKRIEEAKEADDILRENGIDYIGQLKLEDLETVEQLLNEESLYLKVKHIVTENHRTNAASEYLKSGNLIAFGQLMVQSHKSLKENFMVTIPQLDDLVDLMLEHGAIGARMTGAGFGGCVVGLVHASELELFVSTVQQCYNNRYDLLPDAYIVGTSDGAWTRPLGLDRYLHSLVAYGIEKELLDETDSIYTCNQLMGVLKMDAIDPEAPPIEKVGLETLLKGILEIAERRGLTGRSIDEKDRLDSALMGCLMARPSEIISKFRNLSKSSKTLATDWFYQYCMDVNYIRKSRSDQNLHWLYQSPYGVVEITVNLSKPEKDPEAIKAAQNAPQLAYPKCLLCLENVGYHGRVNHPARQNHRVIPMSLGGSPWYFQYSPYLYYNEHAIVFGETHTPMAINKDTFSRLLEFVDQFPHYFIGSNADLPIVGGSILSHDHYQGGRHDFPMAKAKRIKTFVNEAYSDVTASWIHWPLSVVRLKGNNRASIVSSASEILKAWSTYSDEMVDILAFTEETPHNTITPVARKTDSGYELDLVLRNNRTSDKYPLGIFHPHEEVQPIKRENIGVIEVMGLAILPPRIHNEMNLMIELLEGNPITADQRKVLENHWNMIQGIRERMGNTDDSSETLVKQEIAKLFVSGLEHAGVFKNTEDGRAAFMRFMARTMWKEGEVHENQS